MAATRTATRRVSASFASVAPRQATPPSRNALVQGLDNDRHAAGVELRFLPLRSRIVVDPIDDFANLGPEHCMPAVAGIGKVLRLLRAGRIMAPEDPETLLGEPDRAAALLERALGAEVVLELRSRSSVRFVVWTEDGVDAIENVEDIVETSDAYLIHHRQSSFPLRIPRSRVVRHQREATLWYEVVEIE